MRGYNLCLIGFGNIARHLVGVLASREAYLAQKYGVQYNITAIVDLEGAALAAPGSRLAYDDLQRIIAMRETVQSLTGFRAGCDPFTALKDAEAEIMIELTPTEPRSGQPALDHMLAAFDAGMHVVTANKGPLVTAYRRLQNAAVSAGKSLKFGCATAAALPTTNVGYYDLAGCRIERITGILNGTSNYILGLMHHKGLSFAVALQQAQELGIAESDPTLDVDGFDTAVKFVILANALLDADMCFGDVSFEGIRSLTPSMIAAAQAEGRVYKLVGSLMREADDRTVKLQVAPQLIEQSNPLYHVEGTAKAVAFTTDLMGTLFVSGGNSSPKAAAAAILRDLINLSREEGK